MQNDCSSLETLTTEEQNYLLSRDYARIPFADLIPPAPQSARDLCTPAIYEELERIYLEDGEPAFVQHQQEIIDAAKNAKGIRITDVRGFLDAVLRQVRRRLKDAQQEEKQEQARQRREAAEQSCKYPDFTVDIFGKIHLQPTYENFKTMCKRCGISIQSDMIRRRMIIPTEIRNRHSMNCAEKAYSLGIQDQCTREGIHTNANQVREWIKAEADENRVNPVRLYLERQAEDYQIQSDQAGEMMKAVFDCLQFSEDMTEEQYEKYYLLYSKWLVQCVAMAHNEQGRYGAEFVLVLQSKRQGAGKTSFFRQLCSPPELQGYFLEGRSMNPERKDDILENTSCWICELGELESTTRKREMDKLKAFLTNSKDRVRAPYDPADCEYPRLTCYAGTVNEPDFLREAGRRFVVLPIIGVDLPRLKKLDMNRLWAEAYFVYRSDPNYFRLDQQETQEAVAASEEFRSIFTEEQAVRDLLDWGSDPADWREYTASEIARALELKDAARVGKALRNLGYEKTSNVDIDRRFRILHGSTYYTVPPLKRSAVYAEYEENI